MRQLEARRRHIRARGRGMTLRRQTAVIPPAFTDVALLGFQRAYSPEQITGGVQQGDAQLAILNDEIAAAAWPGPPRAGDLVLVDGLTWAVVGSTPVHEAETVIGHALWIRGGA